VELPLRCIVCGVKPDSVEQLDVNNQPYKATTFASHGHYGSTAYDPMDGSFIEVNVCDACLRESARTGRVAEGQDYRPVTNAEGSRVGMERIPHDEQEPLKPWDPS
jgi:hypothetical protein